METNTTTRLYRRMYIIRSAFRRAPYYNPPQDFTPLQHTTDQSYDQCNRTRNRALFVAPVACLNHHPHYTATIITPLSRHPSYHIFNPLGNGITCSRLAVSLVRCKLQTAEENLLHTLLLYYNYSVLLPTLLLGKWRSLRIGIFSLRCKLLRLSFY